jgi:hypothetical protein
MYHQEWSMNCFIATGVPCTLTRLRRPDAFEIHVTLTPLYGVERTRFAAICSSQHWKALVVELDPDIPSQPMTCTRMSGTFDDAISHARFVQHYLEDSNFTVTRIKIEAAPWNSLVPQTDYEAVQREPSAYFEFHAKLILPITGWESTLPTICQPFQAHISHNALRKHNDKTVERFVTVRSTRHGLETFQQYTNQFITLLTASQFSISDTVTEYCVYDSNTALDLAWFGSLLAI